jgi:hypothetical protein
MLSELMRFRERSDLRQSAIRDELGKRQHPISGFVFISCLIATMAELHKAPSELAP